MVEPKVDGRYQYQEHERSWAGTVVHVSKDGTVFLELDKPVPFMMTPDAVVPDLISEASVLDESWGLGPGIHDALDLAGRKIPPGKWRLRFYGFWEPQPLGPFIDFCKKKHKGEKNCWLQAAVVAVVPIKPTGTEIWTAL